jgi:Signal transduction histidine kinase
MNIENLLLIIVSIITILIGLGVILFRPKNFKNVSFFIATIFACIWSSFIMVFRTAENTDTLAFSATVFYIAALGIAFAYAMFVLAFTDKMNRIVLLVITSPVVVMSVVMALNPNLLISSVALGDPNKVVLNDMFYAVYAMVFLAYSVISTTALVAAVLRTRSRKQSRSLVYIMVSYFITSIIGVTFNLILPWFGIYTLIWAGPVGLLASVILIYVAIIRYGLFDARTAAVRLVSRCAVMLIFAFVFSVIFNALFFNLFEIDSVSWRTYLLGVIMIAIMMGMLPIIRRIDAFLNKLFHVDAYDANELINRLNREVLETHDLDNLLVSNARLINDTLKTSFTYFSIASNIDGFGGVVGVPRRDFRQEDVDEIEKFLNDNRVQELILSESLADNSSIVPVLNRHKIAAVMPIRYDLENDGKYDVVGYILLGYKPKRRNFVQNDVDALNIISNLMAIAIENISYYQQIQSFNDNLRREVRSATASLRSSNKKLQKIDAAKDEFMNMASHQLRTPLTSVKGYISMLLDGDAGSLTATQRKFLGEAYYSSNKMVHIVNDFLNVSRLQTGKFIIDKSWVRLDKMVKEEVSNLHPVAKSAGLDIKCEIEHGKDYSLELDESKVRQVISNLIDNAIHYSRSDTTIIVRLYHESHKIIYEVADSGIGVPKSEQRELFTKFYRASNARKRRPDGTGVGLFLAKKIVVASKGGMIFRSVEGRGSVFGFWLKTPKKRK